MTCGYGGSDVPGGGRTAQLTFNCRTLENGTSAPFVASEGGYSLPRWSMSVACRNDGRTYTGNHIMRLLARLGLGRGSIVFAITFLTMLAVTTIALFYKDPATTE